MTNFSLSNIGQPQNKRWKFISKFLCRTLPVYITIIAAVPETALSSNLKIWIGVALSFIVATISGLSELTIDGNNIINDVKI
jgi:hypothetical protein